ncbi:unnamed protein product [Bursaphelenchus xylophilus]|uniref:(pine wood nematode) hypothetical protein n=1 Tax=Bursaphelenchus xylophilus TaxID=6326 RepID=A0A7I8XQ91_BURXY|nr:unnamed protein product [Bursaphelenchus xylophilus]CAG9121997.1 unnamed protein product [Bursaphelenchus xylophilus]
MRATVVLSLLVLISTDICQSDDDLLAPDDNTFEDPNSWSCGSDPLNSKWAGRAITYACIEALPSVNACCESHDECYREKAGRGPCDETFCDCMKRSMSQCHSLVSVLVTNAFCQIVEENGEKSYLQG